MAKSKKVNKWEAAPESIKLLHNAFIAFNTLSYEELDDKVDWDELDELLVDVLAKYNELEAKHNADCGLISKLEEENKAYETLTAELNNDVDELVYKVNNLEKMVEFHKGEVKELVKTADKVRDKHENEVCMLKKDIHDLEVKVKYYKEDNDDLECAVSKYKALYEGLESTVDSVTRERNHFEYTLSQLIEQLKIKNDVHVDINERVDGNYKVENKRAADLQCDLDAAIYDLKKEEENVKCLKKQITRKNAEMCNLKWERDETEKKIKILIDKLQEQYNINVTFYQKPGIDTHGIRNFGVDVDCEENRKAFNELKEALDKHKSQIDKLETKHAKATRFIARLTEALNEAGVSFHYVKIGADGEDIFYIDSLVDRMAKKHYEEQSFRLRNTVRNYGEQIRCFKNDIGELQAEIYKLKKDNGDLELRKLLLLKALDQAGINPTFDIRANKWLIQYTDKAENAFLAADQIKRDAEKKIDDLKRENNNLKQTLLNILEMLETKVGLCRVHLLDSYKDRANLIAVEHDKLLIKYEKLKEENKTLISERDKLKSKNREWQVKCNNLQSVLNFRMHDGTPCGITNCPKVEMLTAERDGLNDYAEALKGRIQELEDRSKDIYTLATIGWLTGSMHEYDMIRNKLTFKPSTCTNCKNFDPKE